MLATRHLREQEVATMVPFGKKALFYYVGTYQQSMSKTMQYDPYKMACPTRELLDRISGKWVVLVLGLLGEGPMRFNALRRQIEGVSQKMLTQTLRGLEEDGLVDRRVFPTVPVTVEYSLTKLGSSLNETLQPLRGWANQNMGRVSRARSYRRR